MTCTELNAEIVECARRGGRPNAALSVHLVECRECARRWKAECELTSHFRVMKIHALARRPNGVSRVLDRNGQMLLREFDRRQERAKQRPSWAWTLAAAAAVLLAAAVGREVGLRSNSVPVRPAAVTHGVRQAGAVIYEADLSNGMSSDAGALSSDEFMAVPYAAPLATGEIVRVVRTNLEPEELASMGIDVNPAWSGNMSADVVVGEDGFPRAVRVSESLQN